MEHVACPLCGSSDGTIWGTKDDASYIRCLQCSLVYENPRLTGEELREYYSKKSYFIRAGDADATSGYEDYFAQCTPALTAEYFSILRRCAPPGGKIKFLDIGCGPGNLLAEASRHGWQSLGLEISSWAAQKGRDDGLQVIEGSLESVKFEENSFDIISMFDVLEHLPAPRAVIAEVRRVLKPGGVVVIETPNIEGFFVRHLYGVNSDMVKPRAHICLWSPATIRHLISTTAFSRVSLRTFPYCRRYTPGYFKRVAKTFLQISQDPTQLTVNESLRVAAWK